MIEYNNKKVTPKVYAKHIISDEQIEYEFKTFGWEVEEEQNDTA